MSNVTPARYKQLELLIEIASTNEAHAHWLLLVARRMQAEGSLNNGEDLAAYGLEAEATKQKLNALREIRNGVSLI